MDVVKSVHRRKKSVTKQDPPVQTEGSIPVTTTEPPEPPEPPKNTAERAAAAEGATPVVETGAAEVPMGLVEATVEKEVVTPVGAPSEEDISKQLILGGSLVLMAMCISKLL